MTIDVAITLNERSLFLPRRLARAIFLFLHAPALHGAVFDRAEDDGFDEKPDQDHREQARKAVRSAVGLAGELLAYHYRKQKHRGLFSDASWVSENRTSLFPEPGDMSLGYDFRVVTARYEWLYEVKATAGDACEFELTDNEYRVAIAASHDSSKRYRMLFAQYATDPEKCRIMELPNPASERHIAGDVLVSHFAPSITDLSASTTNSFLRLNEARKHRQIRHAYLASDLAFAWPNRYRSKHLKTSL